MKVSVVIPTYNRAAELKRCLNSILNQTIKPYEIIVVDASDDDIGPIIKEEFDDQVVYVKGERGLTRQRNIGLKKISITSDIVAFFDDDVVLFPDYLEKIVECYGNDKELKIGGVEGYPIIDGKHKKKPIIGPQYLKKKSLYGCNMSYRLMAIGNELFDENLHTYAWLEDLDFSLRISKFRSLIMVTNAYCYHFTSDRSRIGEKSYGYMQLANWFYLFRKMPLPWNVTMSALLYPIKNIIRFFDQRYRDRFVGNIKALFMIAKHFNDPIRLVSIRVFE